MTGIFYDPANRRLRRVSGSPREGWQLVTHDLEASTHQCRRILAEWIDAEEIRQVDWDAARRPVAAA